MEHWTLKSKRGCPKIEIQKLKSKKKSFHSPFLVTKTTRHVSNQTFSSFSPRINGRGVAGVAGVIVIFTAVAAQSTLFFFPFFLGHPEMFRNGKNGKIGTNQHWNKFLNLDEFGTNHRSPSVFLVMFCNSKVRLVWNHPKRRDLSEEKSRQTNKPWVFFMGWFFISTCDLKWMDKQYYERNHPPRECTMRRNCMIYVQYPYTCLRSEDDMLFPAKLTKQHQQLKLWSKLKDA